MDGIDAALVDLAGTTISLVAYSETPYSTPLRALLEALVGTEKSLSAAEFGALNVQIGQEFLLAATSLIVRAGYAPAQIAGIGSHGQTVSHGPKGEFPYTLQLGDPSVIAAGSEIDTVADFRSKDVALGGQGAPLVPPFHQALFGLPVVARAVVNVGGIANVTLLPGNEGTDIVAFDTGPGNTLLDQWVKLHRNEAYDTGGVWAKSGETQPKLLEIFLSEPYFHRSPPKSTGREDFNMAWVHRALRQAGVQYRPVDVQRTLLELTSRTIVSQILRYLPTCTQLVLCGGGARNPLLVDTLRQLATPWTVNLSDELGVPANAIEAMAFAWLAYRRLHDLPGNLPSVTGASRSTLLGAIYAAR